MICLKCGKNSWQSNITPAKDLYICPFCGFNMEAERLVSLFPIKQAEGLPEQARQEWIEIRVGEWISKGLTKEEADEFDTLESYEEVANWLDRHKPGWRAAVDDVKREAYAGTHNNTEGESPVIIPPPVPETTESPIKEGPDDTTEEKIPATPDAGGAVIKTEKPQRRDEKNRSFPILFVVIALVFLIGGLVLVSKSEELFGTTEPSTNSEKTATGATTTAKSTKAGTTTVDKETSGAAEKSSDAPVESAKSALSFGLSNGLYKQVILGKTEVYCLKHDGTVVIFTNDPERIANNEYDSWNNIESIMLGYEGYLFGIKNDGTVAQSPNAKTFYGPTETSEWKNIVQLNTSNSSVVIGLREDGKILYTPSKSKQGEALITDDNLLKIEGCTKLVSMEAKGPHVFGISADGNVKTILPAQRTYSKGDALTEQGSVSYLEWSGLADIALTTYYGLLFGLTKEGKVLYGGYFMHAQSDTSWEEELSVWTDITAISAGGMHLVALRKDGTVMAAGDNEYGQCEVESWKNIVRIEAYDRATVGYSAEGKIYVAGYNPLEQSGN